MDFQHNHFYVISLQHPYLEHCPSQLVKKYAKNIVVQFKGTYGTNEALDKQSIIFHHHIHDFYDAISVLSHVCQNYVINEVNKCFWESHMFRERFIIHRDVTTVVQRACLKFKQLLKNK